MIVTKEHKEERAALSNLIRRTKKELGYSHTKMGEFFNETRETYIHWYNNDYLPTSEKKKLALEKMQTVLDLTDKELYNIYKWS